MINNYIEIAERLIAKRFNPNQVKVFISSDFNELITFIQCDDKSKHNIFYVQLNGNYYTIEYNGLKIDINNLEVFEIIYDNLLTSQYLKISELPMACTNNRNFNIDLLNIDNFIKIFNYTADNFSNGERAENVSLKKINDELEINFNIDFGRYGLFRDNIIYINNRGNYNIYLCDKLDGSDFEAELSKEILNLIIISK